MNIAELTITNVIHSKARRIENEFYITFELDGFRYTIVTRKNEDGMVYPKTIIHFDEGNNCPHCEGEISCSELIKYQDELFHWLIQFPSIRLNWLFINHVERKGNEHEHSGKLDN